MILDQGEATGRGSWARNAGVGSTQGPERGSLRHVGPALTEATGTNGLNFIFCNTLALSQPVPGHPRTCDLFHPRISRFKPALCSKSAYAFFSSAISPLLQLGASTFSRAKTAKGKLTRSQIFSLFTEMRKTKTQCQLESFYLSDFLLSWLAFLHENNCEQL